MNNDQKFPHISFTPQMSPEDRGHLHGESFSGAIKELCSIRRGLMLAKSPHLKPFLKEYAQSQYTNTKEFYPKEWRELEAIRTSSNVSIEDIVILNNYTDFRDIQLEEEGCTTIGLGNGSSISGQTWDMHSSAKAFVCTMGVERKWQAFSLVGCIGMMGANDSSIFVGVNNLNTKKAKNGIIWPALIRSLLTYSNLNSLREALLNSPVTSGHNYLISNGEVWENWEIGATFQKLASETNNEQRVIYHTNHCLHKDAMQEEEQLSRNSTSLNRYNLIHKKAYQLNSMNDVIQVLQDHEEYPKSVCSHFQSDATDPSTTCGGAVFNHTTKQFTLWRCCPKDTEHYISRELKL